MGDFARDQIGSFTQLAHLVLRSRDAETLLAATEAIKA